VSWTYIVEESTDICRDRVARASPKIFLNTLKMHSSLHCYVSSLLIVFLTPAPHYACQSSCGLENFTRDSYEPLNKSFLLIPIRIFVGPTTSGPTDVSMLPSVTTIALLTFMHARRCAKPMCWLVAMPQALLEGCTSFILAIPKNGPGENLARTIPLRTVWVLDWMDVLCWSIKLLPCCECSRMTTYVSSPAGCARLQEYFPISAVGPRAILVIDNKNAHQFIISPARSEVEREQERG